LLDRLGWNVFDHATVTPEFPIQDLRVDFALCHPSQKPAILIEVKKIGYADGAERQLFEYAFHEGIPMAILTDGQVWSFFLPAEQGNYQERCVYKLDILARTTEEIKKGFPDI
jgi:predicted type IV restriction endonuclease